MDIHSFISPMLFVITLIVFVIRARKDDEQSCVEFVASITIGSILLLFVTIFSSLFYYIIFNETLKIGEDVRKGLVFIQYYYTVVYYIVIILFRNK